MTFSHLSYTGIGRIKDERIFVPKPRTTNPRGPFKPTKLYLKYMVDGAKALGLPQEYVTWFEEQETID